MAVTEITSVVTGAPSQPSDTPSDSGNVVTVTSAVIGTSTAPSSVQSVQVVTIIGSSSKASNPGSTPTASGPGVPTFTSPGSTKEGTHSHNWIVGLVMGIVSLDVIIIVICIMWRRRRRLKKREQKRLERERQRQLAGDAGLKQGEGEVMVNLGVVATHSDKKDDPAARGHRRKSSDSEDWEAAPRPPRPDVTRAYIAKPGGRDVADEYMAQQREQGWTTQGLLPISVKRFDNAEAAAATQQKQKKEGGGLLSKIGLGRSRSREGNARNADAQELGQVRHQEKFQQPPAYNPAGQGQRALDDSSQQETGMVSPMSPEHGTAYNPAAQEHRAQNEQSRQVTGAVSPLSPERRMPFMRSGPSSNDSQRGQVQPQRTGTSEGSRDRSSSPWRHTVA